LSSLLSLFLSFSFCFFSFPFLSLSDIEVVIVLGPLYLNDTRDSTLWDFISLFFSFQVIEGSIRNIINLNHVSTSLIMSFLEIQYLSNLLK
jgi:hypothetical protein